VNEAADGKPIDNVIVADYTRLNRGGEWSTERLLSIDQAQRDAVERRVAIDVADQIMRRLPRDDAARKRMVQRGQALVARMSWDHVLEQKLRPVVRRVLGMEPLPNAATPAASPSPALTPGTR
jgi:hypothetical protein